MHDSAHFLLAHGLKWKKAYRLVNSCILLQPAGRGPEKRCPARLLQAAACSAIAMIHKRQASSKQHMSVSKNNI